MRLADLRRYSVRKQVNITFELQNGMDCVITDRGVAQVPALKGLPDFNLEDELASASAFRLEAGVVPDKRHPPQSRSVSREQMEALTSQSPTAGTPHDHDDE